VAVLNFYFDNPEIVTGSKPTELIANPLIKSRMEAFLRDSQLFSGHNEPKRKAIYFTKVVTQSLQILPDSRIDYTFIEEAELIAL
jgi:hypothetical protein